MALNSSKASLLAVVLFMMSGMGIYESAARADAGGGGGAPAGGKFWVYVGTYTKPPSKSEGIYLFRFDSDTGAAGAVGVAEKIDDPEWLTIAPGGKFMYACVSINKHKTSTVAALSIDRGDGGLTFLNREISEGASTCHLGIDPAGTCAIVANYDSGTMTVLPIGGDGKLMVPSALIEHTGSSVNPKRQAQAHPHSCNFDPSGKFVLVPDLGVDKIYVYRFDAANRKLLDADPATVSVAPGSGPRHLAFSPDGKFAYLVTEMGGSLIAYAYDAANGGLGELQTVSILPPGFQGKNTSAEVEVDPSGRFLYASNRGADDIGIFAVDRVKGTLTPVGFQSSGGRTPRAFSIDPTGKFLFAANRDSDSVVIFRIDQSTGKLTQAASLGIPTPVCVTFLAANE